MPLPPNEWSADGYPNWSADGYPGWTADGYLPTPVTGTVAPPAGADISASEWSADSTELTADTIDATADGWLSYSTTSNQYADLITSEHNQRTKFMSMVRVVTGAIADITAVAQGLNAAFDLDTAIGVQLDIVGQWVGQARVVAQVLLPGFFGFLDDSPPSLTMGEQGNLAVGGVFYENGETYAQTTTLSDSDYRTIIRARIVRNQSNGTLSAIENSLEFVFQVPCRVVDIGDLSIGIIVSKPITAVQQALLTSLDLLPRPAGVQIGSLTYSTS